MNDPQTPVKHRKTRYALNFKRSTVERRKAWRILQSKTGVVNKDYLAQRVFLAKVNKGEISLADAQTKTRELLNAELVKLN